MDRSYGIGIDYHLDVPQSKPANDQAPSLDLFIRRTARSRHHLFPSQGIWMGRTTT
jgi:hypothetical protein